MTDNDISPSPETEGSESPVAVAQKVLRIGEGRSLANRLNQHIRRAERGEIELAEAQKLAASCDKMLADIFETRSLVFEKKTNERGQEKAPEFNAVKGALNTLRLRLAEAFPEHIQPRATMTAAVGSQYGF